MCAVFEVKTPYGNFAIARKAEPGADEAEFISDCFGKVGTRALGLPASRIVKVLRFIF